MTGIAKKAGLPFSEARYRPEIDGLRAIAVLAVIIHHGHFSLFGAPAVRNGYLGVDIFFVISGYLIGRFVFAELEKGTFSLLDFWLRRAKRILPALFGTLAGSLVFAVALLPPQALIDFAESLRACVFFVANIFFYRRTDYFAEPGDLTPLLHLWSLSVEEQFYLIFPLSLAVTWRYSRRAIPWLLGVAAAASLFLAIRAKGVDPAAAFYLFPYRAWELLVGAILAYLESKFGRPRSRLRAVAPLFGMLAIFTCFFLGWSLNTGSIVAVVGAVLIISGRDGPVSYILGHRALTGVGAISYSLYLLHQPLFAFARNYSLNNPGEGTFLLLSMLAILAAALSWRYVEQPWRTGSVSSKRFASVATIAGLALTCVAGVVVYKDGLPGRFDAEQLALLELRPERGLMSINGRTCTRRSVADACKIGDSNVSPSFAILGDSHAETLTIPLDRLLRQQSASALMYTNAGCPFIKNVAEQNGNSSCSQFVEEALAAIRKQKISRVIINDRSTAYILGTRFNNLEGGVEPGDPFPVAPLGFTGSNDERIQEVVAQLRRTIRQLLANGITIYYILPVPEVGWHVPKTLAKLVARGGAPLTTSLSVYLERHRLVLDLAKELSPDRMFIPIYPHLVFCHGDRCVTHEGDVVYYTDTDHLSLQGADKLISSAKKIVFPQ
ncbi:acyltransferase [Bradyrhizobium japonicum]|uniref:acyltransferase family protein n=1 Tax=Bradyrhizobium japonicum TaxID=375 RepID=UPI001BA754B7|nr:acyltransferase family protein [Bradyrhizobium japonicum]MBR0994708.1 acyltransferase [Bradyrhizobium japonicum]